jgi:hypothetical protein
MSRRACLYLGGSFVLAALAGCGGGWLLEQREPWRHEAEVACLKSGAVKETAVIAQLPAINGPGMCGADFPLKVAALGESAALGFADDPRPPAAIPQYSPVAQRSPMPPRYGAPPYEPTSAPYSPYGSPPDAATQPAQPGAPLSLKAPGTEDDDADEAYPASPAAPGYGQGSYVSRPLPPPADRPATRPYSTREGPYDAPAAQPPEPYYTPAPRPYGPPGVYAPQPGAEPLPPLGPASPAPATASAAVTPAATLACPMVSQLDQWITGSVQPAALRWFGQPVAEIKQISAYSCRGMNGNRRARISEHAFGNALDVAAFTLADGRKVTVREGWRGLPEERGFLHDVHAAACQQFSTVLGPGSNVYHYDHLHLDLMRRSSGRGICNPAAVPGDLVAGRMGYRPGEVTGSVHRAGRTPALGFAADGNPSLPVAVPGED